MAFLDKATQKLKTLASVFYLFAIIFFVAVPIYGIIALAAEEVVVLIAAGGSLVAGIGLLIAALELRARMQCYEDVHNILQSTKQGKLTQAKSNDNVTLSTDELPEI